MATTASPLTKIKAIRLGSWLGALLSLAVGVGLHVSTGQAIENDAHARFMRMARNVSPPSMGASRPMQTCCAAPPACS